MQEIIALGDMDVPEIYWIKGHSGIHGNEIADKVVKRINLS